MNSTAQAAPSTWISGDRARARSRRRARDARVCRRRARCSASLRAGVRVRCSPAAGGLPARARCGPAMPELSRRSPARRVEGSRDDQLSRSLSSVSNGARVELLAAPALAQQDLDLLFGLLQRALAHARQLHAALELLQRFVQRQVALLELLDDGFELGERALEVGGRRVRAGGRAVSCWSRWKRGK